MSSLSTKAKENALPKPKQKKYLVEPAWLRYETEKGMKAVKKILAIWAKRFKQLVTASTDLITWRRNIQTMMYPCRIGSS